MTSCASEPWRAALANASPSLHALDRLDAHDRRRQSAVEALVPLAVGAQADRHAVGDHLEDAAQRVAGGARGLDQLDGLLFERCVAGANRRLFDQRSTTAWLAPSRATSRAPLGALARAGPIAARRGCGSRSRTGARTTLPRPPAATREAVSRALARSSTLRTSSSPYLTTPARSAWPGPQAGDRRRRLGHRLDVHLALPVGPVAVLDHHGDRAAHRPPCRTPGHDLDAVVLDLLPSARGRSPSGAAPGRRRCPRPAPAARPAGSGRRWSVAGRAIRRRSARADSPRLIPRLRFADNAASYTSIGGAWPVQRSNASAAWCSNMPNPFSARAPAARAATMKPVTGGL